MTKINHRSSSLRPARGTAKAYDSAPLAELAFYDAKRHIGTSRNISFGRRPPSTSKACAANCGHPACRHGCTLHNGVEGGQFEHHTELDVLNWSRK